MCEPATILAVGGLGLSAAGSGVSAYDQYKQGAAAEATGNINARRLRMQATDVRDRASDEAGLATMEGSKVVGEQTVAAAASGVDSSSGTAADIAEASRVNAALDSQTIRNNAAREAWGLKIQALQVQQEGKRARRASEKGAVGTVLGGLGSVSRGIYGLAG